MVVARRIIKRAIRVVACIPVVCRVRKIKRGGLVQVFLFIFVADGYHLNGSTSAFLSKNRFARDCCEKIGSLAGVDYCVVLAFHWFSSALRSYGMTIVLLLFLGTPISICAGFVLRTWQLMFLGLPSGKIFRTSANTSMDIAQLWFYT